MTNLSDISQEYLQDIINKQNKLIENLKETNKLLEKQIIFPIDNQYNMEKIMKFIKIIYGLADIVNYHDDIYIYGSLFESFFAKKSLEQTKLYFLFQYLNEYHFYQFVERLNDIDYVINNDYNTKKRSFICMNQEVFIINYWDLQIQITDDLVINVRLHDNTYSDKILFDCQNIILTKIGFTIRHLLENNKKYVSTTLLSTINNLLHNQVEMTKTFNEHIEQIEMFKTIEKQNSYLINDFEIKKGFNTNKKEEETCAICYREHKEDGEVFLYELNCKHSFCSQCLFKHMSSIQLNNHNKCPLCRQKIIICISTK